MNDKTILITGGTGSFGKACTKIIMQKYNPKRIIIFSRDELKQFQFRNEIDNSKVEFFLGDVRDKERLYRAFNADVDIVIHAAALKQISACERNPFEAIKTNIFGAQNIIEAAIDNNVEKVLALSTDKAVAPINLYGATKLASDKLFLAAHNYVGKRKTLFSVVRYGNVMGSRGSVIPFFISQKEKKVLPITSKEMTRFNLTLKEAINFSLFALENMKGAEIFVPKIPSYRIMDIAKAIMPEAQINVIGIREGEKLHEELITKTEALNTLEFKKHFIIYSSMKRVAIEEQKFKEQNIHCKTINHSFSYNSKENEEFLTVSELKELIEKMQVLN